MSEEAIYWIFSTLPQVLAALTGLVMAGLTIYDQNLKKQIENDSTKEVILAPLYKKISKSCQNFIVCSISTIIVDIAVLAFARAISGRLSFLPILSDFELALWIFSICLIVILNVGSLLLLYPILNPVLNPGVLDQVKKDETEEVKKALEDEAHTSDDDSNGGKENSDANHTETDEKIRHEADPSHSEKETKVSPMRFIDCFRKFEQAARAYFPSDPISGKKEGISFMARQLANDGIIPRRYLRELQNIIRLRNLYLHEADIGDVDIKIIDRLREVTGILHNSLLPYRISRGGEQGKLWGNWIRENVEDLDEAYDLDQAIRHKTRYGKYNVMTNGHHTIITSPDDKLVLPHKDEKEFLRILESGYTSDPSYTIEEEKDLRDALRKIQDED